jgi:hypothetical protein
MKQHVSAELDSRVAKYTTNPKLFEAFAAEKNKKEQTNAAYRNKTNAVKAQLDVIVPAKQRDTHAQPTSGQPLTVQDLGTKGAMNILAYEAKKAVDKRNSQKLDNKKVSFHVKTDDFDDF